MTAALPVHRHRTGLLPVPEKTSQALASRLGHKYGDRITGCFHLPGREGEYAPFPDDLPPALAAALRSRGIDRLYSHQAEAWAATQRGEHTVVVTPTASGKTLCYTLPVVAAAMRKQAKALYLFPTKALAQDQVAELLELNAAGNLGLRAYTFDGDTPGDARQAVRLHGDIVVSNPDMLHQGILPHHTKWAQFFENLQYVVIDEIHSYRGVFGSHLANVLRRLKRVCAFYGATPQFILCSATIGNPKEHAEAVIEAPVTAITRSGAPTGDKTVMLWNPPVVNPDLGLRASARSQSNRIARLAIKAGLKTLVFAQSRTMVEVLTKYLKDVFDHDPRQAAAHPRLPRRLPAERAPRRRARHARGPHRRHRQHLGAGAGRGHRLAGCRGAQRLSRLHRRHLATAGPRRTPAAGGAGHPGGQLRPARPVPGAASGVLRGRAARACAPARRPAADPARPHPLRRLRAALPARRDLRPGGLPGPTSNCWPKPACCTAKAAAGNWIADTLPGQLR